METIRVLAVAPYEGMRSAIARAAEAFPGIRLELVTGDLEEGAELVRQKGSGNYDAIISRGGTAELIAKIADCPVVATEITFYDALRCIRKAENYTKHFAVVGYPGITEPTHALCDLLDAPIRIITIRNPADAAAALDALRAENYELVICDRVTQTLALERGFEAFLITSGAESIRAALAEAEERGRLFSRGRHERIILRSLLPAREAPAVVLREDGQVYLTVPEDVPEELIALCRNKLPAVGENAVRFHFRTDSELYDVTGQILSQDDIRFYIFSCRGHRIQLRSGIPGIRTLLQPECEQLFAESFFSLSGALGELEGRVNAIARSRQPVMILGEAGSGKEQIARLVYLRSPAVSRPFVVIDGRTLDARSWDHLMGNPRSPLTASGGTVYFRHLEEMPASQQDELLSVIQETGLANRIKLIFSCLQQDDAPAPEVAGRFAFRLGALTEYMPCLRRRSDEIPSLAALYLNGLNLEMGKRIAGFEPNAMEQLCRYDWPGNYTQFKYVLRELATHTDSAYIRADSVAELLTRERSLRKNAPVTPSGIPIEGRTLADITDEVIRKTVSRHGGNQTAAARQLGISRSTLWRSLRAGDDEGPKK